MLTVNNLTLTLHHRPLLREIAFSVSPGEVLTLMGPSGSGKSTLFAWMIGALEAPFHASGELWLYNERCDERPTERRRIGILFQDALLFDHFSVGQNLLLALPADIRGAARKIQVQQAAGTGRAGRVLFPRSGDTLRRPARPRQPAPRPAGAPAGTAAG
ncbi:Fe(3+) ions import ATP-binding protein FbpC 2 [Raoultella ornithinolytica]|nr:Fe(3+) ions import ATP-binding protein FbpC 2 [Raoultella ornithinolytica]